MTPEGFRLEGLPAIVLLVPIVAYFVAGSKYMGGTVWQRILYK